MDDSTLSAKWLFKNSSTKSRSIKPVTIGWMEDNPGKSAAIAGAAAVSLGILRHRRRKKFQNESNQGYSATIVRGRQQRLQGSAAGMNNAKSAWIGMNGGGYDNPNVQGARYNFGANGYQAPPMSSPSSSNYGSSRMSNYRRPSSSDDISNMF